MLVKQFYLILFNSILQLYNIFEFLKINQRNNFQWKKIRAEYRKRVNNDRNVLYNILIK